MDQQPDLSALAEKWLKGTISATEKQQLEDWYNHQPGDNIDWSKDDSEEALRKRLLLSIVSQMEEVPVAQQPIYTVDISRRKVWIRRLSVAAAILLILGSTIIYLFTNPPKSPLKDQLAINTIPQTSVPVSVRATLTLANGSIIHLDSIKNGIVALQGSTSVHKGPDGQIIYEQGNNEAGELYNTLTVPRGSQVLTVVLGDGSKVWLNVESSMRYPVAFNSQERKVRITGEAYFEVDKDAKRKFLVEAAGATTEVLGTHFNVNTYESQGEVLVTLLEGAVKVTGTTSGEQLLKPGQQADVKVGGSILLNKTPDLEAVMAWKEGLFKLNNSDIYTIMAQLARWYDFDVRLEKGMEEKRFAGTISRNTDLKQVLDMLSMTKEVGFKQEGRTISVYPFR
jgi:transmembrane sensor